MALLAPPNLKPTESNSGNPHSVNLRPLEISAHIGPTHLPDPLARRTLLRELVYGPEGLEAETKSDH